MHTQNLSSGQARVAADILKNGGLVAIPTETVYGLAANAFDAAAISRIFTAKGRPSDNPLIVHIADFDDIFSLVSHFPKSAVRLAEAFWPGPLTMILPKSEKVPRDVSAGLPTVAVRFPAHPVAQEVIRLAGVPLAAPSANLSGSPSPTTFAHVINDLDGKIDAAIDGGACEVGLESTVVTLSTRTPRLLRPGAVTAEQIKKVIGEIAVDPAVFHRLDDSKKPSSPGMKYKHYAPRAKVVLIKSDRENFAKFVNAKSSPKVVALCYDEDLQLLTANTMPYGKEADPAEQAKMLFDALRKIDMNPKFELVYARCPGTEGVGMAVYNRLIRAAGFEVMELE